MANQFVNLPATTGNGVGAAVDVSTFGALKTIVCSGDAKAAINVEFNNAVLSTDGSWQSVATFQNTGQLTVNVAARWMRVRVSGYNPNVGGTPLVDVGGTDEGTTFATLVAPATTGAGAAVNTSALGVFKTVQIGGSFRGTTIIEASEDGATEWGTVFSFQNPGAQSAVFAAKFMRVKRVGVPDVNPGLPIINVGATDDSGGGGGGGGPAISAGSQSVSTGTVLFADSNGVTFGMSASSRVTASFSTLVYSNSNNITFGIAGSTITASASGGGGGAALSAGTQSVSTGTVVFSNSNNVTFGMSGSSRITASASFPAETPFGISAGTQSGSTGTMVFSNSNNVTFGMSGSSQVTASASFPAETPFGISAGTQSGSTGTMVFSNSNNVTFGMSGSSRVTASASFPAETPFGISAGTQSGSTGTMVFSNSNNVTFGMSGSSQVTASASFPAETPFGISAGTQSGSTGTMVFSNSNNVTFGMSGSSRITASVSFTPQAESFWQVADLGSVGASFYNSSMSVQRVSFAGGMSATRADLLIDVGGSLSGASYSLGIQLYTMSGSSASSVSSGSIAVTFNSSTNATAASAQGGQTDIRWRSIPLGTWNIAPGEYLLAITGSFTGSNASFFHYGAQVPPLVGPAVGGGNFVAYFAQGVMSAGTNAFPASFQISDVNQSNTYAMAQPFVRLAGTF